MKRRILLPTDFSKNSLHAIKYAINLYKNDACVFFILNAFTVKSNSLKELINLDIGSQHHEKLKQESEKKLANLIETLKEQGYNNSKHELLPVAVFNHPVEAIKNIVEQKDIELIVMGSQGVTRSRKVAFGSNSISVMEKIRNCPSIIVPEVANINLPKEIVFPTSFKTHFKIKELNHLISIAKNSEANIAILHIKISEELDKKQLENKALLEEYFSEVKHSYHFLSNSDIESAVNHFIESRESDMVAFINKKHAFFGSVFTQPLVKGLGFYAKVPILALHDLRN